MKINIIWGKYVVYDYGWEDISSAIGNITIDIKDSTGVAVSELEINTTDNQIVKLPTLSRDTSYNIEIDDGILDVQSDLPSEDEEPEPDGIKISELPNTSSLQQGDLFAISRDDGEDGSYNRTLHVTLTDLIASINPSTTYTLTVNGATGGEVIPLNPENYQEGADVTAGITMITGTEPEYNFLSWTSDWPTLDGSTDASLNFQMPAQDVTLTPNVEVADNSTWTVDLYNSAEGGGGWDPDHNISSDGVQKITSSAANPNQNGSIIFYYTPGQHSGGSPTYTCRFIMANEHAWVKDEINAGNYDNLRLDFVDSNGSVIQDSLGTDMSYNGEAELTFGYFGAFTETERLGILAGGAGSAQITIEFDKEHSSVRAVLTQISSSQTVTSIPAIVYSDIDPVFGYGQ